MVVPCVGEGTGSIGVVWQEDDGSVAVGVVSSVMSIMVEREIWRSYSKVGTYPRHSNDRFGSAARVRCKMGMSSSPRWSLLARAGHCQGGSQLAVFRPQPCPTCLQGLSACFLYSNTEPDQLNISDTAIILQGLHEPYQIGNCIEFTSSLPKLS